jgi:hypothetical protein
VLLTSPRTLSGASPPVPPGTGVDTLWESQSQVISRTFVRLVPSLLLFSFAMASSLPPVSPGSVPPTPPATDSVGNGSAYGPDQDVAGQMDRDEHGQGASPSPAEVGDFADQHGGADMVDDEGEYDGGEMNGWNAHPVNTFDESVYTAHQDFVRAAAQFVSPMGYDVFSPDVWGDSAPLGPTPDDGAAHDIEEESAIDAFNRQAALAASSIGYDVASPSADPGGSAFNPDPSNIGSGLEALSPTWLPGFPGNFVYAPGSADTVPVNADMNDSSKRGRIPDASSVASSVRAAKRPAVPPSSGTGAAASSSTTLLLPTVEQRLQVLTDEVAALQISRAGLDSKVRFAESELQASVQARRVLEHDSALAVGSAKLGEQTATAALQAVRAEMSEFVRQASVFKNDVEHGHELRLSELRAEAASFRAQSDAHLEKVVEELRVTAEARHSEAMSLAVAGFAAKETQYVNAASGMREQYVVLQRSARSQQDVFEREKQQLQDQISDLMVAATVASLGPVGGTSGVDSDVQSRLDHAIHTVAHLGAEVNKRDTVLAQYDAALRSEQNSAKEKHTGELAFQVFVDKREKGLKHEILQLNQKLFILENAPEDTVSATANAVQVKCRGLEDSNRVLRAQLSSATLLVEQFRAAPLASPALPSPSHPFPFVSPCGTAADIRHPTLHSNQGADEFLSAQSLDDWFGFPSPISFNVW